MPRHFFKTLLLTLTAVCISPAFADEDPSLHQVYTAAQSGHLDQAQQMMGQVLKDHPNSAKAHYVESELDAKQGQFAAAREELSTAERLEPGLPFAKPDAVRALQAELASHPAGGQALPVRSSFAPGSSFPWGALFILLAIGAVIWMVIRNRRANAYAQNQYSPNSGQYPARAYPAGGVPPGYGPQGVGPVAGGGIGSGIAGGLASGLAVGAGVVAGEELAHHFLDGDRHRESGTAFPPDQGSVDPNGGMGGSDFGVQDSGSWDDGGSVGGDIGGGGGGDDWS